jgi:nitrogen regulatory protein PII-like uncharacterized protein
MDQILIKRGPIGSKLKIELFVFHQNRGRILVHCNITTKSGDLGFYLIGHFRHKAESLSQTKNINMCDGLAQLMHIATINEQ